MARGTLENRACIAREVYKFASNISVWQVLYNHRVPACFKEHCRNAYLRYASESFPQLLRERRPAGQHARSRSAASGAAAACRWSR